MEIVSFKAKLLVFNNLTPPINFIAPSKAPSAPDHPVSSIPIPTTNPAPILTQENVHKQPEIFNSTKNNLQDLYPCQI